MKQILLKALRPNEKITPNDLYVLKKDDWDNLINLSKKQYVLNIFYSYLKENNLLSEIPKDILEEIKNYYQATTIQNLKLKSDLIKIAQEFNKNDIPLIILKGSHLAFYIYPHISLRFMRDLDILIPKDKCKQAFSISEKLGYKTNKPINEEAFNFDFECQLPQMVNENNTVLEIHSNIIDPGYSYSIKDEDLWKNLESHNDKKCELLLFSPEDLILHLCNHISYKDVFNSDLRHYYDIFITINYYSDKINWDILIKTAKERNWEKGVYLVLKVIEKLFQVNLPDNINDLISKQNDISEFINLTINLMWEYDRVTKDNLKHTIYSSNFVTYKEQMNKTKLQKLQLYLKKTFIPKKEISYKYNIDINSPKIYLYYLIRPFLLYKKHNTKIKELNNNEEFNIHFSRRYKLFEWLN